MNPSRFGVFQNAAHAVLAMGMALPGTQSGAQSGDASGAAERPGPAPCSAPQFRQFDFWIGHWDVFQPDGKRAGENLIEPILGGCALRETWQGRGGFTGTSLNAYDAPNKLWRQTWLDNQGGRLDLAGAMRGQTMVLEAREPHPDKPGVTLDQRISWSVQPDASVRQLWETSDDGGKTWSVAFDGKYVRRR